MNMRLLIAFIALLFAMQSMNGSAQPADDTELLTLAITGKVADGDDHKLGGCEVLVFKGNDIVGQQVTDRGGRFSLELGLGEEFSMEFRMEGFLPKKILVDTRATLPKEPIEIAPVVIDMHMMPAEKYKGADTDVLDFPFAIVRWDRKIMAFAQDHEYTADMMRTNGALLLMSGRATKK